MHNKLQLNTINAFSIDIMKENDIAEGIEQGSIPHIHDFCEIYVNLSGNVSFIVEKNIYSIQPGDIIITRPYEYHHCIFHDDSDHFHYWILFSSKENPELFNAFFNRTRGTNNLIRLPENEKNRFLKLCETLCTINPDKKLETMSIFFEMISHIESGIVGNKISNINNTIPKSINQMLTYIDQNYASIKNIHEVAKEFHISMATLERHFKTYVAISPKKYLLNKKLSCACRLLRQGTSVTDACFESGFSDFSHFIALFKKTFGTTPLKYKKEHFSN